MYNIYYIHTHVLSVSGHFHQTLHEPIMYRNAAMVSLHGPNSFSLQEQFLLGKTYCTLRSNFQNPANTKDDWVRGSDQRGQP